MSQKWTLAEVEAVPCCGVRLRRALAQGWDVGSSLKPEGGGTGVAGGCTGFAGGYTGEMATSLRCVVLESSQDAEP